MNHPKTFQDYAASFIPKGVRVHQSDTCNMATVVQDDPQEPRWWCPTCETIVRTEETILGTRTETGSPKPGAVVAGVLRALVEEFNKGTDQKGLTREEAALEALERFRSGAIPLASVMAWAREVSP